MLVVKIDKRTARRRWNLGLPIALAQERDWFPSWPVESITFTRAQMVERYGPAWADFDYMVSQSVDSRRPTAYSLAAPDLHY